MGATLPLELPPVLDACCGPRMMWFDKADQRAVFSDVRHEYHTLCDGRALEITPDLLADFTALPFADDSFHHVVFDPPHLDNASPNAWMAKKYGRLTPGWQSRIERGFRECFRVLRPHGTLIFKWNETRVPLSQIRPLMPQPPLYGHHSGKQQNTHWLAFVKMDSKP